MRTMLASQALWPVLEYDRERFGSRRALPHIGVGCRRQTAKLITSPISRCI